MVHMRVRFRRSRRLDGHRLVEPMHTILLVEVSPLPLHGVLPVKPAHKKVVV